MGFSDFIGFGNKEPLQANFNQFEEIRWRLNDIVTATMSTEWGVKPHLIDIDIDMEKAPEAQSVPAQPERALRLVAGQAVSETRLHEQEQADRLELRSHEAQVYAVRASDAVADASQRIADDLEQRSDHGLQRVA